jgi:hypothetical protein
MKEETCDGVVERLQLCRSAASHADLAECKGCIEYSSRAGTAKFYK